MYRRPLPSFDLSPLRWRVLLLIAAVAALGEIDRATLESMVLIARDTLRLPDSGTVLAERALGLGFGLALPIGAILTHVMGARTVLLWGAIGCAGATGCMGFVGNLGGATLFFLWFGVAAGLVPAAALVALIRWFPLERRGVAIGSVLAASGVSAALVWTIIVACKVRSLPLVVFLFLAALGIAWIAFLLVWYSGSFRGRWTKPVSVPAEHDAMEMAVPLAAVIRRGWPLLLLAFAQFFVLGLCRDWLPAQLLERWHLDILSSFQVPILDNLMLALGCICGGMLTDRCLIHSHNVVSARQIVMALGTLFAGLCLIPMITSTSAAPIVFWQVMAIGCLGVATAPLWCLPLDIAPAAPAPMAACVAAGYMLAMGLSAERLGHLVSWMLSPYAAAVFLVAAVIGVFFVDPSKPLLPSMGQLVPEVAVAMEPIVLETETARSLIEERLAAAEASWEAAPMDDDELLETLRSQGLINLSR
jgi:MFS family permease